MPGYLCKQYMDVLWFMKGYIMEETAAFFPLFINPADKRAVIVGGGTIASRRALVLSDFGFSLHIVAPVVSDCIERLVSDHRAVCEKRCFRPEDLDGAFMVLAATDDEAVNDRIVQLCRERGIWVNHAGKKEQSDFYFPGIVRAGNVVAGVTASGSDHRKAAQITRQIRSVILRDGAEE